MFCYIPNVIRHYSQCLGSTRQKLTTLKSWQVWDFFLVRSWKHRNIFLKPFSVWTESQTIKLKKTFGNDTACTYSLRKQEKWTLTPALAYTNTAISSTYRYIKFTFTLITLKWQQDRKSSIQFWLYSEVRSIWGSIALLLNQYLIMFQRYSGLGFW